MAVKCILTGQTPSVLDGVTENVQTQLNDKVDKITGKGLSTNDYTSTEKTKLSGIEKGAQKNTITGVKGSAETTYRTGNVNITATNIGLGNVNNTSDTEKPISTATQTALNGKQATITGAATTITNNNLTANRALISNSSGKVAASSVTSTELGYLDGVTSNIQTQLNNKLSSAPVTSVNNKTGAVTLAASDVGAQSTISANGILKGDGSGNITAANETEVELVSLPNICNPNLLDNWYFGNPVNQRGQTSYTGSTYGIDRWCSVSDGTVAITVTNDGIKIVRGNDGTYANFVQRLTYIPTNTTFTLSFLVDNYASVIQIFAPGSSTFNIQDNLISLVFNARSSYPNIDEIGIQVHKGKTVTVKAAKLELGSQQTLAHQENGAWVLNEIPDYGEQLLKCQRYLRPAALSFIVSNSNGNYYASTIMQSPYPMRTVPAIVNSDYTAQVIREATGGQTATVSQVFPPSVYGSFTLHLTPGGSTIPNFVYIDPTGFNPLLSAEL